MKRLIVMLAATTVVCEVVAFTYDKKPEIGDVVIAHDSSDSYLPASVTGFWEKGVTVRSEQPASLGANARYAFNECRITTRNSKEWKLLTGME